MTRIISDHELAKMRNAAGENIPVPPPPRKRPKNEESRIQQSVITWWSHACRGFKVPEFLLLAIPNGGWRGPITGSILKREGLRPGASDLFLAVPVGKYHGLWLELKKPDGVLRANQEEFQSAVIRYGYAAHVSYDAESAIKIITGYLKGEEMF